jgi:thioredoxin reductase (NADPH)
MDVTRKQAERFGTEIAVDTVLDVDVKAKPFVLTLETAGRITADAVIVASGASAKYLGLESEKRLLGYGVSACATCDGFFFRGKEVVVVGGGDTAMEEAIFLTKFCTKVILVHRRGEFRASKIMAQRALANPKIEVLLDTVVEEILGEPGTGVTGVRVRSTKTGTTKTLAVSGYFAAIGHQPNTAIFAGKLDMNDVGYLRIEHPTTKTSVEGIFAAGDVADSIYRQAVSAAGEGCKAAIDAERWLSAQGIC